LGIKELGIDRGIELSIKLGVKLAGLDVYNIFSV
jgi:hypothetical protein